MTFTPLSPNQYSIGMMKVRGFDIAEFFGYRWVLAEKRCIGVEPYQHWCLWKPAKIEMEKKPWRVKRPTLEFGVSLSMLDDCLVPDWYRTAAAKDFLITEIAKQPLKLRARFVYHLHDTTHLVEACKAREEKEEMRSFVSFHLLKATPAEVAEAWWRTIMKVPRFRELTNDK